MSEDRTKKDPLLGGLDGMRAGQHWEGEPESLRHPEKPDQAQEAFSAEKVQSAEEEARKIAQELHREAVRTGNTEKRWKCRRWSRQRVERKSHAKRKNSRAAGEKSFLSGLRLLCLQHSLLSY